MPEIKVTRKGYVRKDGTVVKGTTYYTKDKGKPGKTPESEEWYEHSVRMNWHKDEPAGVRRANALKSHEEDELVTARALQALANVTTERRPLTTQRRMQTTSSKNASSMDRGRYRGQLLSSHADLVTNLDEAQGHLDGMMWTAIFPVFS